MMTEKLDDLKATCDSLGITITETRRSKLGKTDLIMALQNYWLGVYSAQGTITHGQKWVHAHVESPQLAQRQTYFKPEVFESFLNSSDYCADVKEDGVRILMYYHPETGFEFFSRNRSVTDYLFSSYATQIKGLEATAGLFSKSFCLDAELISLNPTINGRIVSDSVLNAVVSLLALNIEDSWVAQEQGGYPLRFKVFDILMFDDLSLMDLPLRDRILVRDEVIKNIRNKRYEVYGQQPLTWIEVIETVYGGKETKLDFYNKIVKAGGEGIILKNLRSPYLARDARGGQDAPFIKVKRTVSESAGSDIDGFIVGYSLGESDGAYAELVGSLDIAVILIPSGVQHVIARCSNIPLELRKKMTVIENGKPILDPKFLKTCVTIDGLDISSRAKRFVHSRITSFRPEKNWFDCQFEERLLDDLVL